MALTGEVEQTAGGGDQEINAARHGADLVELADAAEDHGVGDAEKLAVGGDAGIDLGGKFAGGCQDQHIGAARRCMAAMGGETMQDRQQEGGRLACAGLSEAQKIAPGQQHRDGLRLDRRGGGVAFLLKRLEQLRVKAKIGKGRTCGGNHDGGDMTHVRRAPSECATRRGDVVSQEPLGDSCCTAHSLSTLHCGKNLQLPCRACHADAAPPQAGLAFAANLLEAFRRC